MKIKIPDTNGDVKYIEDKHSIVLIGANGAGKTRMSVWIDENNHELKPHRISAQKSLNMPESVSPSEMEKAKELFSYGITHDNKDWLENTGKRNNRWGRDPETHLLNDFQQLMVVLETESYEKSIDYREKHKEGNVHFDNETKLEKIKNIWENVITHRKLKISAGKIEVYDSEQPLSDKKYNGSKMSDGERAIFYFIGEVVCAEESQLIIIDEPENHLHKSILTRLWDAIENERTDCTFLYITHNLDFASTRLNSQLIWVKSMSDGPVWEYELLDSSFYADELRLEILGNRQKILLVEGTVDKSIDRKLYSRLYPNYNIIPLESCASVIQAAKSYKRTEYIHYAKVIGIVDRDRRSEEEIQNLKDNNIIVPLVAEVENLFVLPEIIKIVAKRLNMGDVEGFIGEIKSKTLRFLQIHLDDHVLLFTRQICQNIIIQKQNVNVESMEGYKQIIQSIGQSIDIDNIYADVKRKLNEIIERSDFYEALKVINNKGLIPEIQLSNYFGWKKDRYIDFVLGLLSSGDNDGRAACAAIKQYISVEDIE